MSLILDALSRSQRERSIPGEVPAPAEVHYPGAAEAPAWRRSLPWLALALALVAIAWLLWDRESAQQPPTPPAAVTTGAPEAEVPAPESAPLSAAQAVAAAPAAIVRQTDSAVPAVRSGERPRREEPHRSATQQAALDALYGDSAVPAEQTAASQTGAQDEGMAELIEPSPPMEPAAVEPAAVEPAAVEPAAVEPAAVASEPRAAQTVEEPVDLEKMIELARREMDNQRLVEHPAPFLASLSQQTRDAIPTLMYSSHDWTGESATSSVVINGRSHRPGAQVASGVRLDEILPDSVILRFRDKQFRLKALNSWVNL